MINRRIMGFVEGFVATTGVDRYGRSFSLPQILALRDEIDAKPWLFLGLEPNEPPAGRVTRSEVREMGSFSGLWARVEFYQASALKITSEGILNFFGLTTPAAPMERRRPEDFAAYEAMRLQQQLEDQRQLAAYHTPPAIPIPPRLDPARLDDMPRAAPTEDAPPYYQPTPPPRPMVPYRPPLAASGDGGTPRSRTSRREPAASPAPASPPGRGGQLGFDL